MTKSKNHIASPLFTLLTVLGVAIGFLSLTFNHSLPTDLQDKKERCQADPSQDMTDEDSQEECVLKAYDAIPTSSIGLSFNHEFLLIEVLPDLEEDNEPEKARPSKGSLRAKAWKILFRSIISPNAP